MTGLSKWWDHRDAFILLGLVAWHGAYFFPVTLAQAVWFGSDMVRTYFPLGTELARALSAGRLPFWTTGMYGGFPLLADAQIGALYPGNLILFAALPPHLALSYSILLHLAFAACGMFLWIRACGFQKSSAALAGIVFSFGGFMLSRLPHATILLTSVWLPWLIFFQDQFQRACAEKRSRAAFWFALTALAVGVQVLCGFPQIAFMNMLAVALVGFCAQLFWMGASQGAPIQRIQRAMLRSALPLCLGVGLAAIQILPTAELVGYSVRGGASSLGFVTSYSLPPEMLGQFVAPFIQGEPSEGANNEYWAYLGLAPFLLAVLAVFRRRDARTIFFALGALGALSLALGEINPLYRVLYQLPGFSFFRVPARYLLLFVFAGTFLSASGFEELSARLSPDDTRSRRVIALSVAFGCALVIVIWFAQTQWLDFWMSVWRFLPIGLGAASFGVLILAWRRRVGRATFQGLILGLTLFDLACAAPLFVITLGRLAPPAYAASAPRSVSTLDTRPGDGRVFADLEIDASVPAIRAGLVPNTALLYGKESAQAYSSLAFARHSAYLADLTPAKLNLLNVRYLTIPLEPRPETKSLMPRDTLGLDVLNNEEVFAPTAASGIEIITFTERADDLENGTLVGELLIRRREGQVETFPLRVGIETADWDYARKNPQHTRAPIAHAFPAGWRSFGRGFEGNTYIARFTFVPSEIVGVNVRVLRPEARLTVERITLYNSGNLPVSLAELVRRNDFTLAYLSDTAAVWENQDALPRAFIAHAATIVDDDSALARLHDPVFQPVCHVLLADEPSARQLEEAQSVWVQFNCIPADAAEITKYESERVEVTATTNQSGYLVLADSLYPGWRAFVDGQPAPILRVDVLFRAVLIEPGTRRIVFEYHPGAFQWGVLISSVSLALVGMISIALYLIGRREPLEAGI